MANILVHFVLPIDKHAFDLNVLSKCYEALSCLKTYHIVNDMVNRPLRERERLGSAYVTMKNLLQLLPRHNSSFDTSIRRILGDFPF